MRGQLEFARYYIQRAQKYKTGLLVKEFPISWFLFALIHVSIFLRYYEEFLINLKTGESNLTQMFIEVHECLI